MIARDQELVSVLRMLKSAILYEEVAKGVRDEGLGDTEVLRVIARESKKRADTTELYEKAGETERADTERAEKAVIDKYLPEQMSEEELTRVIQEVIAGMDDTQNMGKVIAGVKQKVGMSAEGALVAKLVKQELNR